MNDDRRAMNDAWLATAYPLSPLEAFEAGWFAATERSQRPNSIMHQRAREMIEALPDEGGGNTQHLHRRCLRCGRTRSQASEAGVCATPLLPARALHSWSCWEEECPEWDRQHAAWKAAQR